MSFRKIRLKIIMLDLLWIVSGLLFFLAFSYLIRIYLAVSPELASATENVQLFITNSTGVMEQAAVQQLEKNIMLVDSSITAFFIKAALTLLVFYITWIALTALLKGISWCILREKQFSLAFYMRFAVFVFFRSLLWILLFVVLYLAAPNVKAISILFTVGTAIIISSAIITYPIIEPEKKIKEWICPAKKIYCLVPQLLIVVTLLIALLCLFAIAMPIMPLTVALVLFFIALLIFSAWQKSFMALSREGMLNASEALQSETGEGNNKAAAQKRAKH